MAPQLLLVMHKGGHCSVPRGQFQVFYNIQYSICI